MTSTPTARFVCGATALSAGRLSRIESDIPPVYPIKSIWEALDSPKIGRIQNAETKFHVLSTIHVDNFVDRNPIQAQEAEYVRIYTVCLKNRHIFAPIDM